jgi:hypothetical protein
VSHPPGLDKVVTIVITISYLQYSFCFHTRKQA